MSDFDWDDDQNYGQPSEGGKLRKQLEEALSELKTAKAEVSNLGKELTGLKASRALETRGLPAKAAKFMQADGIDVTDSKAVDAWLDDNKDIFSFSNAGASAPNTPTPPADPDVDSGGFQRLADLKAGREPEMTLGAVEQFVNGVDDDVPIEEFLRRAQEQFG